MLAVQQDFRDRVGEIEVYFDFAARVDAGEFLLTDNASGSLAYAPQAQADLLRTFKASAVLMLYNLMESTVCNAVEAVFDDLSEKGICFDDCRVEVRRVILGNLKQHSPDAIEPSLQQIGTDIISKTFRKDSIVSGNVDARKIRELANAYGMEHPRADGSDLRVVKENRNDLAHGSKSFAEVGRGYAIADILRIKSKVIAYLTAMLSSVATYIEQENYRNAPIPP